MLAAVPVKPFGVAKARLAPLLDAAERSVLGKAIAAHTVDAITRTGSWAAVVTRDAGVAAWARGRGYEVIDEGSGRGLDAAAAVVARRAAARGMRWAIVHADLPLISPRDVAAVLAAGRAVIAPSYDGGTSVLVGSGPTFPFSYGVGSFHRHLAAAPAMTVVSRPGLAFDLDTPRDLIRVRAVPAGAWLAAT